MIVARFDAGNHRWSKRFGTGCAPSLSGGIALAPDGSIVVVGDFQGSIDFGGGPLESPELDASAIPESFDVFVVKLSVDGSHRWSKHFGDVNSDRGYAVDVSSAGEIALVGEYGGSIDFGGGPLPKGENYSGHVFLAKLDGNGNHLLSRGFSNGQGWAVRFDRDRNVLVAGKFWKAIDFGRGPLTAIGGWDLFVAKLDPAGAEVWSRGQGGSDWDEGFALDVDPKGSSIVAGYVSAPFHLDGGSGSFGGHEDAAWVTFGSTGDVVSAERYGDFHAQRATAVAYAPDGDVVIAGWFRSAIDFGNGPLHADVSANAYANDLFVAKCPAK